MPTFHFFFYGWKYLQMASVISASPSAGGPRQFPVTFILFCSKPHLQDHSVPWPGNSGNILKTGSDIGKKRNG